MLETQPGTDTIAITRTFDRGELINVYNAPTAVLIDQDLRASKKYQLIDKIPNSNSYGKGNFWIWRKL